MTSLVAKHNSKILKNCRAGQNKPAPSCNCQRSRIAECPLPGKCNTDGVVYQAIVRSNTGGEESYIGLAKNFKKRFRQHKASMTDKKSEGATTLSSHFWKVKEAGGDPTVKWKFLEQNIPTFNPVRGSCRLCLREKYNILMNSKNATLNSRTEIFTHCRHIQSKLIGKPPD